VPVAASRTLIGQKRYMYLYLNTSQPP